jgi:hypothetical protein
MGDTKQHEHYNMTRKNAKMKRHETPRNLYKTKQHENIFSVFSCGFNFFRVF